MTNHERPDGFLLEERPSLYDLTTALRWLTTQDSHAEFVSYFDTQASEGQKPDLRRASNAQIISIQAGEGYVQYVLQGMGQEVRLGLLGSD